MSGSKLPTPKRNPWALTRHPGLSLATLYLLSIVGSTSLAAKAADTHSELAIQKPNEVRALLHESGMTRLYSDLGATVLEETAQARQICKDSESRVEKIRRFIDRTLTVDQLMDATVEQMSQLIEPAMIEKVAKWMNSEPGQLIMAAEAASADWSIDEFERRETALANSSQWDDARKKLLAHVVGAASIVNFVTALHSETSALVLYAGDCSANDESRAALNGRIEQARRDEAFYRFFLRDDMLITAAMIFTNVSDEDLNAFVSHSESEAGQAWNKALLTVIRQVLRDQHAPVQHFLTTLTTD